MKMLHTCIRVKDLEKSLTFYAEAFDMKELRRMDFPEQEFTIVYLGLEGDEYELELTYNYGHPGYELGNGYGHIAIGVKDFEALHQRQKAAGHQVTDFKSLPNSSVAYYFITDPDGYKIEVIKEV